MTATGHNPLHSRLVLLRDDVQTLLLGLKKIGEEILTYGGPRVQSDVELRRRAMGHLKAIDDLLKGETAPAGKEAWGEYNRIRDEVTQVNQEVLEMVAALAMHRENVDAKVCWIVRRFLEDISAGQLGLTVFTARDLNFPTLARLARVRFPVKSVWTLPLAAHHLANLQIKDAPKVDAYALQTAKRDAEKSAPQTAGNASQNEVLRRKAEAKAYSRAIQLISDSLAVLFTGPCYAASATLLRLSPLGVELEDESQASDIDRAFVILETLRQMNVVESGDEPPYATFITWLEGRWNAILEAAGSAGPSADRAQELTAFVGDLVKLAGQELAYALYPLTPADYYTSGGWSIARKWALEWANNIRGEMPLTPGNKDELNTVRDAFNAGWAAYAKIAGQPGARDAIGNAVMGVCEEIVRPYYEPAMKTQPAGPPGARARPGV